MENREDMTKSIDQLLDEHFGKSDQIFDQNKNKADEVVNKAPKGQDDAKRNAGRPKELTDVPKIDKDGKRAGKYDEDITSNRDKEHENEEAKKQCKEKNQVKKSEKEDEVLPQIDGLTKAERAELEDFRNAKKEEDLKKAEIEKENFIKSIVEKTADSVATRYESLIKSQSEKIEEQGELIKAMANKPQRVKSITNIQSVEKSETPTGEGKHFSKSEVQEVVNELVMKKALPDVVGIEYERDGNVQNPYYREIIENELKRK